MMSPSPIQVDEQFETDGHPSNLDRCTGCGFPRSSHGPGWSCPAGASRGAPIIPLLLGALLTISGLIVSVTIGANAKTAWATLGMVALLSGLTLLVAGTVLRRRLR